MHTVETLRTFQTENYTLTLDIVDFCMGSNWLAELYTATDTHQAGTTIKTPDYVNSSRHAPKFYIGPATPAQLARDYAKQGRENPSREAYDSLQRELAHYMTASDCAIRCTVTHTETGIELAESFSCGFDHSDYLECDIEENARRMLAEYGRDFIREAIKEARDTIRKLARGGMMFKFTLSHVDTCLPDYWGGHHLPVLQIPVRPGMSLSDIKSALRSELNQGAIGGSAHWEVTESPLFYFLARQAIDELEGLAANDRYFTDIEEPRDDSDSVCAFFVLEY